MARIPQVEKDELTEEERQVYEAIVASRGGIGGPFRIWLHSPELADRAQRLGEFVRYRTSMAPRLSELAILTAARFWDCQVEWSMHEPVALKAGIGPGVIDAIRDRRRPTLERADESAVYAFTDELLNKRSVGDETFAAALEQVGRQGVVELTVLLGYYSLVAMTLNVFHVPMPEGTDPLLTDSPTFF